MTGVSAKSLHLDRFGHASPACEKGDRPAKPPPAIFRAFSKGKPPIGMAFSSRSRGAISSQIEPI
jgi:hypothetical protein